MVGVEQVLARLDLSGCPVGTVLDKRDPDQSVEERFFRGWINALTAHKRWNMPSMFRVIKEGEKEVLEHIDLSDRCLVTGDSLWRDYTVKASIRHMLPISTPNADDLLNTIGRSGIMFRYQDLRHYYFFCLEGYERLVLYRREDDTWSVLSARFMPIDRGRYYNLKVQVFGNRIKCYLDGEKIFEVVDGIFQTGKAGIRTNTLCRISGVSITMTEQQHRIFEEERKNYDAALEKLRAKYPKPKLFKVINLGKLKPKDMSAQMPGCAFGYLGSSGRKGVLVLYGTHVTAIDMEENILWQVDYNEAEGVRSISNLRLVDIDGNGVDEIVCVLDDDLAVMRGESGKIVGRTPLPRSGPFINFRNRTVQVYTIYTGNLRGKTHPQDILIRDGGYPIQTGVGGAGYTFWAYDDKLNPLWTSTVQKGFGHNNYIEDIDGDGKDEVIAGYEMLDHDGSSMWLMDGAEYILDGQHVDCEAMGKFEEEGGEGATVVMAASSMGVFFVDAETGKIRRHHPVGHAQCVAVAKFRADLPGLQVRVGNRWGNYGIITLFTGGGEKITSFEPDNVSQGGTPVNWTGEGEELQLITTSPQAFGMYDAYGRKVVEFPEDGYLTSKDWYFRETFIMDLVGDARDEIAFLDGERLLIYTQDTPFPKGRKIYAPLRKRGIGHPVVSYPNWKINDI